MVFGHLAVSVLQHRYLKLNLGTVMAAGIFPDLVDKTLCQVLHWTPSGRMFGHTGVGLGFSAAVVGALWGRRAAWTWMLGYLGHLIGDAGGFVPWLYPFAHYDFTQHHGPGLLEILRRALTDPAEMGLELALAAWAAGAVCWPRVKTRGRVSWETV